MVQYPYDGSDYVTVTIPSAEVQWMMQVLWMDVERCEQYLAVPLLSWDEWHSQEAFTSAASVAFLGHLVQFLPQHPDLAGLVRRLVGLRSHLLERVPVVLPVAGF